MNLKRIIGYSILLWILIFVAYSIIMFLPWFKGNVERIQPGLWVVEIPLILLWSKAYFKKVAPTWKSGIILGIAGLLIGTILDLVITVPLFVKSYSMYYGNWLMYVGFVEMLILTTVAGAEFDGTYSQPSLDNN